MKKDHLRIVVAAVIFLFITLPAWAQPQGQLAWYKAMEEEGVGYEAIKRKLRVIFYESASFRQQMKTFTMEELCNAFEIMQRADRTLKSSSLNGRLVLERMILKLCDASRPDTQI